MNGITKKRLALVALLGAALSSAALRGCWDPTEPEPWVSDGVPATEGQRGQSVPEPRP